MRKFCLLISFGFFSLLVSKGTPKTLVTSEQLRERVAQVPGKVHLTSSSLVSQVTQQILEIQRRFAGNLRKCSDIIENYQDALSHAEKQCSSVNPEHRTNSASLSEASETLGEEASTLFLELTETNEMLGRILESLIFKGLATTEVTGDFSSETETTATSEGILTTTPSIEGRKLTPEEFDAIIRTKSEPAEGKSFNCSSSWKFFLRASSPTREDRSFTVVIVNYVNRPLKNLDLYDPLHCTIPNGPKHVPPNTKEIFVFSKYRDWDNNYNNNYIKTTFSFHIVSKDVRLACVLILMEGDYFGMEFVHKNTSMQDYYNRDMISPESPNPYFSNITRGTLFVNAYENIQARAVVTMTQRHRGSLRIEIIDLNELYIR